VLNPLSGLRWLTCFAVFGGLTPLFPGLNSPQSAAQNSAPVDIVYFPLDALRNFSDVFAGYLKLAGEPSSLAAEHDRNVHAYRLEWLSAQHGYKPIVRLVVNADGTGTVFIAEQSGDPHVFHTTQRAVPADDVSKFLQMVERANFWWTSPAEHQKTGSRKVYTMDASTWAFEGVRNGGYHVIFHDGTQPKQRTTITDMIRSLAQDLAHFDDAEFPHPAAGSPPEPNESR
jgi:hypothetical protein